MSDVFLWLWLATMLLVPPSLLIVLIVRLVKKKSKWQVLVSIPFFISLSFLFLATSILTVEVPETSETTTTEQVETTTEKQVVTTTEKPTTTEKVTTPPTTTKKAVTTTAPVTEKAAKPKADTMVSQFVALGFTQAEAKEMKKIFTTVGITEISNIKPAAGSGIDKLQSFTCDIYDYHRDKGGVSVHFTIDKRQLCFISLDGIPSTKTDAYINIFGNVKFKTTNSTRSVTLYDKWDENGEIDESAMGYIAVFDYENKKITKYE